MWRLLIITSVAVVAFARPELYKETEDFQYSRSSSDDGDKSGFYGARRGNMGGNYERAHNMDGLAQHQMSTAVRQVEGELGEGAKTRTGSVYTAANSRGIFGSGHYDLSNLKGRNFEESESLAASHSSLTSQNTGYRGNTYSAAQNAGYNSGFTKSSRMHSGYQAADYSDEFAQKENAHAQDYQANRQYSYGNQEASGSDLKYYSQVRNQAQNQYEHRQSNLHNTYDANLYSRQPTELPIVDLQPRRIYVVPIKSQDVVAYSGKSYNKNSINSEAEVLDGSSGRIYVQPVSAPKHYESSYSYRKEWEKHNSQPVTIIPTDNPFPKNSELYDDAHLLQNAKSQFSTSDISNAHSSSANLAQANSYIANTKSSSLSKSRYSESQAQGSSAAALSNAYTLGAHRAQQENAVDASKIVEDLSTKPKSYHSSYSYHKSWERRGDPYVIKPVGGDVASQRLVSASNNQDAFSSRQYGAQYKQAHQRFTQDGIDCDCDENGHIRVARSPDPKAYYNDQEQEQQLEAFQDMSIGQQVQNKWENLEDLGQQTQQFGQFAQNKWDNLEDLGQKTQNQWDKTEDFGQASHNQWPNQEGVGQQIQNQWSDLQEPGQQTQNKWDNLQFSGQQIQDQSEIHQNMGQRVQNEWNTLQSFDQQAPSDITQQTQDDKFEQHFHEQSANEDDLTSIPTTNQNKSDNKHNSETQNWNVINNFNTAQLTHSFDQKETMTEQKDEKIEQQNQFWNIFQENYPDQKLTDHTLVHEQAQLYNNKEVTNNNYNTGYIQTDDKHDSFQQNHNQNTLTSSLNDEDYDASSLLSLWNKLDRIESSLKNDSSEQQQSSLSTQSSYHSWDKFDGQHTQSAHGDSVFNLPASNDIQKTSTTEHPHHEKETTTYKIYTRKPTQNTYTTQTNIPKYVPQHSSIPQGPVDIGRGDIGAEETIVDDTDNTAILIPKFPTNLYKTPEEIESLSLTNEHQENNDYHSSHKENTETQKIEEGRAIQKNYQDSNYVNNLQAETSPTTVKYNKLIGSSSSTQKNFDELQNMHTNINKEILSQNQEVTNKRNEEISQFDENQKFLGNNFEKAPPDFEQPNMNQQFEDFSQHLQGSLDLGQQQQSSWQPSDSFDQSYVQQLENFGTFSNDDTQHNQDQTVSQNLQGSLDLEQQQQSSWQPSDSFGHSYVQQLENFGTFSNDDNQHNQDQMVDTFVVNNQYKGEHNEDPDYFKPATEVPKEGRNQYIKPNREPEEEPAPVFEEAQISKKVAPQVAVPEKDANGTPVEVPEEKSGFWKSIGSKFTNAKESVVSWFKG
ncbi:putative uncharacterized protein DDB_G0279653 [Colias croceus]|uniref:putative uncharacterized protein DDB_G0279653 n=1 Tax=Colias crocea TaxID=72248 RepID=UPI001E280DFF|nr:putative uncharacterized protein DDB_G0279653 [Colias croceus]